MFLATNRNIGGRDEYPQKGLQRRIAKRELVVHGVLAISASKVVFILAPLLLEEKANPATHPSASPATNPARVAVHILRPLRWGCLLRRECCAYHHREKMTNKFTKCYVFVNDDQEVFLRTRKDSVSTRSTRTLLQGTQPFGVYQLAQRMNIFTTRNGYATGADS